MLTGKSSSRRSYLGLSVILVLVGGCASPSDQPGRGGEVEVRGAVPEIAATSEENASGDSTSSGELRETEIAGDIAVQRAQEVIPEALLPTGYHHVQDVTDPRTGSVVRLYGTDQYDAFLVDPVRDKGPVIAVRVIDGVAVKGAESDQSSLDGGSRSGVDTDVARVLEGKALGAQIHSSPDMESAFSISIPVAESTIIIAGTGVPQKDLLSVADGVLK